MSLSPDENLNVFSEENDEHGNSTDNDNNHDSHAKEF
jgi:hypothetical protein